MIVYKKRCIFTIVNFENVIVGCVHHVQNLNFMKSINYISNIPISISFISRFYTETNITSSKLLHCKNGKTSKIILKTEVFLFVNVKKEDGWNLSLRQEKANLDERKESNRRILANIMLIFVRFVVCSRRRTLFHNFKLEDKQIK